ncbi:MAG: hypothetical protein ACI9Y1_000376 [Lentisphaeria bacterium]|jgi:uncharacterized protein (TIRG00374 family)
MSTTFFCNFLKSLPKEPTWIPKMAIDTTTNATDKQEPSPAAPLLTKKWAVFFVKASISIALLTYIIYQADQESLVSYVKGVPLWFVFLAWLYYAICQWISAYRWQIFLKVKDIHVSLKKLFSFYMVGMFLNNFLPGAVGGDIVKTADLYLHTKQGNYAISSVFLERFTGLVGLTIVGVLAAITSIQLTDSVIVLVAVLGTAAFLVCVTLVLWYEPLMRLVIKATKLITPKSFSKKFTDLFNALHSYKQHPKAMLFAIATSIVLQLMFALYYGFFAMQLGIDVDIRYFILFLPAITLVTMLPLSIGGLGVREGLMVVLFAQVGIGAAEILSISLTVHVVNMGLSLFGGLILALRKPVGADSNEANAAATPPPEQSNA